MAGAALARPSNDNRSPVDRLLESGDVLPEQIAERIRELGSEAVPRLLEILTDEPLPRLGRATLRFMPQNC